MKKYKVSFETTLYIDAIEAAENQVYVSGYCGNGGCDKLVGVSDSNMSVYADDNFKDVELENVEEIK